MNKLWNAVEYTIGEIWGWLWWEITDKPYVVLIFGGAALVVWLWTRPRA